MLSSPASSKLGWPGVRVLNRRLAAKPADSADGLGGFLLQGDDARDEVGHVMLQVVRQGEVDSGN